MRVLFERGIKISDTDGALLSDYGLVLLELGDFASAERALKRAIEYKPLPFEAHYNLAVLMLNSSQSHDATAACHLRQSLEINPNYFHARRQLAWLRATSVDDRVRDGRSALADAQPLAQLFPNNATVWDVLAPSQAEFGLFDDAFQSVDRAAQLAAANHRVDLAARINQRAQGYARRQPYRR